MVVLVPIRAPPPPPAAGRGAPRRAARTTREEQPPQQQQEAPGGDSDHLLMIARFVSALVRKNDNKIESKAVMHQLLLFAASWLPLLNNVVTVV